MQNPKNLFVPEEARSVIENALGVLPTQAVPLADALGRILREPVAAPEDSPATDVSAMDGYAVADLEPVGRLRLVGEARAGSASDLEIGPGECARIFTGAMVPIGAVRVIMQEEATVWADGVEFHPSSTAGHIRRRGENARKGDVLMAAGQRIGPGGVALLAGAGILNPRVSPAIRVIHLVTGDELVDPGQVPGVGQIRDTNTSLIAALLAQAGAERVHWQRVGDTPHAIHDALQAITADWDLLLVSGGASVGDYDFGATSLEAMGFETHFRATRMRPGKPTVFATRGAQAAFVLPGNPVSHFVVFHLLVRTALDAMSGALPWWPSVSAVLSAPIPAQTDRRQTYWPAHVELREGTLQASPLKWQSSGDLGGLAEANALLQLDAGQPALEAGERIACLWLDVR